MCSGSGVSEDVPPHRASLRKAALAWIVGYLYTAVDPCQMYFEQYVIVIFTVGWLIDGCQDDEHSLNV